MIPQLIAPGAAPFLLLGIAGAAAPLLGAGTSRSVRAAASVCVILPLAFALGMIVRAPLPAVPGGSAGAPLVWDPQARLLGAGILLCALCALPLLAGSLRGGRASLSEEAGLLLLATLGALLLVASRDLVLLLTGLATATLATAAMAASDRRSLLACEGSLKMVLLGALAGACLLYGAAVRWGTTGTLSLSGASGPAAPLGLLVLLLWGIGAAFKMGLVPVHLWVPDALEGAPGATSTWIAGGFKLGGLGLVIRLLVIDGPPPDSRTGLLWILAALSILVGSLGALAQRSLKRLLAYSGIAHAGFAAAALAAVETSPVAATRFAVFYLVCYAVGAVAAFGAASFLCIGGRDASSLDQIAGLSQRRPFLALLLTLSLLHLAGIPPTAGFAIKAGLLMFLFREGFPILAWISVAGSVLGIAYVWRPLAAIWLNEPAPETAAHATARSAPAAAAVLGVLAVLAATAPLLPSWAAWGAWL